MNHCRCPSLARHAVHTRHMLIALTHLTVPVFVLNVYLCQVCMASVGIWQAMLVGNYLGVPACAHTN